MPVTERDREPRKPFRAFTFSWFRVVVVSCATWWWLSGAALVPAARAPFDTANDAWRRGDYIAALNGYLHQATDLLQNENHQLITETSKTTIATLMRLASSPSRLTNLRLDRYTNGTASLSWSPSAEKGIASYVVASGSASDPQRHRINVTQPHVTLPQVVAGTIVSVKAVNARGLDGWDRATVTVGDVSSHRSTQ